MTFKSEQDAREHIANLVRAGLGNRLIPIVPTKVKIRRPKKRRAPGRRVHLIADKSEEPFVNMFCREAGVLIDSNTFQSQNVVPASPTSRLKCTQDETAATCERCLSGLKRAKAAH